MAGRGGTSALLAAALSLAVTAPASAQVACPDAAMVQSARVVEFETMMMVVSLRCKHVGVQITDHNEQMVAARTTMFDDARSKLQGFLRGNDVPVTARGAKLASAPVAASKAVPAKAVAGRAAPKGPVAKGLAAKSPATGSAAASRPAAPHSGAKGAVAKGTGAKLAAGRGRAAQISTAESSARNAPAAKASVLKVPAAKPQLASAAPAKGKVAGPRSRRDDPFDQYVTRLGSLYGMGSTTPERCRSFDAIAVALADRTSPDRLLTSVAGAMVETPLIQKLATCPGPALNRQP